MADYFEGLMSPNNLGLLGAASGLLQAGGPSRVPVSTGQAFGQGLMGGLQAYGQGKQMQMSELQQKLAIQKLLKEQEQLKALQSLYGPASQPPAQQGPTPPGMSPNTSMAAFGTPDFATLPQKQAPQQKGPSLDQLGALAATGYKMDDLLKLYELQNPKTEVTGGYAYNPRDLKPGQFLPQVNVTRDGRGVAVLPGPDGVPNVSALPGSVPTFAQFQGVEEEEKAKRDPFLGVTDSQGRPIPMTRSQFAQTYGPKPEVTSERRPQSDIVDFAPTEADALRRVQEASKKGLTAYISVDPAKSGGMGLTPAQRTTQTTIAEGDSRKVLDLEAKIPSLLSVNRRLDRMSALTADDRTYAAAGSELKTTLGSIAQAFGLKVNESKTANTEEYLAHVAELLKDRLASKDFGSGTGVSNLDIIAAQKPLPELAKTAAGRQQLIKALKADTERNLQDAQAARDYFDQNQSLRGFRYPSEIAAQNQPPAPLPKSAGTPPAGTKVLKYNPATRRLE